MIVVKTKYRGKTVLLKGGRTLSFPSELKEYNEAQLQKFPQFFERIPDSKPSGRKSRKADNGLGDSGVQGNKVDKVGRGRKRRPVSTEDSGSVPEQQNAESSPNAEEQLGGLRPEDGEREPSKED